MNEKVSKAESFLLNILDGMDMYDIEQEYYNYVDYAVALREATEYDFQQSAWVKRPNYDQLMAKYNG